MSNKGVTFIIFGATGNLTMKKLIPSIYNLVRKNKVSKFSLVAVARKNVKIESLLDKSKKYIKDLNKKNFNKLKSKSYYYKLDFYDKKGYGGLDKFIHKIEKKNKLPENRIFFMATMPEHFEVISKSLKYNKTAKCKGFSRVVFEKPFGHNLKSAKKINKQIKSIFKESQIYRIDHYLGKEVVENIHVVRFKNSIFEPLLNRKHVKSVQIILTEDFGFEERGGAYYDKYGAIRDVVQNHMIQLLTLTCMERPKLDRDSFRDEKIKVMKKTKIQDAILGQYRGYKKEKDVKKNSKTETFAALRVSVNNPGWKGVPFYFITGKKMKDKKTEVHITFKKNSGLNKNLPNHLDIRMQPNAGFYFQINVRKPGTNEIVSQDMDYCHECILGINTPDAYENLLGEIIKGNQKVFVRSDGIEQEWRIVDPLLKKKNKMKLYSYGKRSYPKQINKLLKKGDNWHFWLGKGKK